MDARAADLAPLVDDDPPAIGPYTLLGRLGVGGMGVVYLARKPDQHGPGKGELVAVKTLHPVYTDDPDMRRRFRTEAAYARRVASFCTARVIEDADDRTQPYLVTEFIEGPPLSVVVAREGRLSAETAQAVAIGVADALCTIHAAGLVHRDLKPSNVLLAESGPRIIDFGIAHEVDAADGPTKAGIVMGSPGWIAPERLTGGLATAASDVFCWGLLVAFASTGRHPFGTGDAAYLSERIVRYPPDLLGLKEPLHGLVKAALAKDPALRPSAEDLLRALMEPMTEETAALAVAELWEPPPRDRNGHAVTSPRRARRAQAQPGHGRQVRQAGLTAAGAAAAAAVTAGIFLGANPGAEAEQPPQRIEVTVTTTVPSGRTGGGSPQDAGNGLPPGDPRQPQRPSAGPTSARPTDAPSTKAPPAARPRGGGKAKASQPPVTFQPERPSNPPTEPPAGGKPPEETTDPEVQPSQAPQAEALRPPG